MTDTVPNPYLAALKQNRQAALGPAHQLETALDAALRAMQNDAWTGGRANDFLADLTGQRNAVRAAGSDAIDTFDRTIDGMPAKVEPNSWYVRWHNL